MTVQTIGRYQLKYQLGRGGMATVYRAYDPAFDRDIALKVLPREFLHDPTFLARFRRETKMIATLEHAAIVPVYDAGEDKGQPFLAMRYLDGGTLTSRLEHGALKPNDIVPILNRLCSAIDLAHNRGVIHRDLKPDNILFDIQNQPYITDFGIAKFIGGSGDTLTSNGVVIGTPAYLSPEQANGEPLDGRSDIYALGVILFEMLTGKPPFQASTPIGLIMKHITEPIPQPVKMNPELPPHCNLVTLKALAKDRDERYDTAMAMAKAFSDAVNPDFPWPDMSVFDAMSQAEAPPEPAPEPTAPPKPPSTAPLPPEPPPVPNQPPITPEGNIMCQKCGTTNSQVERFCRSCGQRLKVDCPRCYTENLISANYCTKCGAQLKMLRARRAEISEFRQQRLESQAERYRLKTGRQVRERIQELLKELISRRRRTEALTTLNQMDKEALDALHETMREMNHPEDRYLTIKAFGQICSRDEIKSPIREYALQVLVEAVDDPDPRVRKYAQSTLERLGNRRSRDLSDLIGGILK